MRNSTILIPIMSIAFVLSACGKQPTEMQKAQIEQQIFGCLTAVTTQVGAESSDIFSGLTSLTNKVGSADDMSKPSWTIKSGTPEIVNMSIKVANTKYSCDYVQGTGAEYDLVEVRRNNEVVFNLADDEKARAENKRLAEEKRIEEERQKELERVEKIKEWIERSYSNVSYKYYEKRHVEDSLNNYSSPKFKIKCNPKGVEFEYDRGRIIGSESRDHPFSFLIDGERVEKKFDLTDSGGIGKYDDDNWFNKVGSDKKKQAEFMALFTKSEAVFVDGFEYRVDDLSQIPCMK